VDSTLLNTGEADLFY